VTRKVGTESGGDVRHRVVTSGAPGCPAPDLPCAVRGLPTLGEERMEGVAVHLGTVAPGVRAGRTGRRSRGRTRRPIGTGMTLTCDAIPASVDDVGGGSIPTQ
jgi:hypothetical protein